jgi:hypothetical protein
MATIKKNNNFFFPSNPNVKKYYYPSANAIFTATFTASSVSTRILYTPIYITRYIENPNFCIEITNITGTLTVQVGIYSSINGLVNAPLLWKGNIVSSSIGIPKVTSNIKLKEDWYILASTIASIGGSTTFRIHGTNMHRVLFGEATDSLGLGNGSTNSFYYEDIDFGLGIPNNIVNPLTVSVNTVPMVVLEY